MVKTQQTSLNHDEIPKENIVDGKNCTDEFKPQMHMVKTLQASLNHVFLNK